MMAIRSAFIASAAGASAAPFASQSQRHAVKTPRDCVARCMARKLQGGTLVELAIGQPIRVGRVFNRVTGRKPGLIIPPLLLARADKAIN